MKKYAIGLFAVLSLSAVTAHAAEKSRFSGEFSLNTGIKTTHSNLDTEGAATLTDLGKGTKNQQGFVAPLGSLYYSMNNAGNQRLYLGTSRDDLAIGILAFEVGYQYDYRDGTKLDIAYLPTVVGEEVWANPYLTNERRETTDRKGDAYRVKLSNLGNSGWSLDMAYATSRIDDEKITDSSLLRDGDTYFIKGAYRTMLTLNSGAISSFSFTDHNAEGKAASYHTYEGELTYFYMGQNYALSLTGSYAQRNFDAASSTFAKTRQDDVYRLSLAYEYKNIPGWDNWSLISFVGTTITESNIDFYSSDKFIFSLGANYKF